MHARTKLTEALNLLLDPVVNKYFGLEIIWLGNGTDATSGVGLGGWLTKENLLHWQPCIVAR
jgi:hypothetical protein